MPLSGLPSYAVQAGGRDHLVRPRSWCGPIGRHCGQQAKSQPDLATPEGTLGRRSLLGGTGRHSGNGCVRLDCAGREQFHQAIVLMRNAADLEDRSEKHIAMENRLSPMRELLGELLSRPGSRRMLFGSSNVRCAWSRTAFDRFLERAGAAESGKKKSAESYYRQLLLMAVGLRMGGPSVPTPYCTVSCNKRSLMLTPGTGVRRNVRLRGRLESTTRVYRSRYSDRCVRHDPDRRESLDHMAPIPYRKL